MKKIILSIIFLAFLMIWGCDQPVVHESKQTNVVKTIPTGILQDTSTFFGFKIGMTQQEAIKILDMKKYKYHVAQNELTSIESKSFSIKFDGNTVDSNSVAIKSNTVVPASKLWILFDKKHCIQEIEISFDGTDVASALNIEQQNFTTFYFTQQLAAYLKILYGFPRWDEISDEMKNKLIKDENDPSATTMPESDERFGEICLFDIPYWKNSTTTLCIIQDCDPRDESSIYRNVKRTHYHIKWKHNM
jgi:hypothetical protein